MASALLLGWGLLVMTSGQDQSRYATHTIGVTLPVEAPRDVPTATPYAGKPAAPGQPLQQPKPAHGIRLPRSAGGR